MSKEDIDRIEQLILDLGYQQRLLLTKDNGEIFKLLEKAEKENATLKADYAKLDECYTILQRINAEIDPRDVVAENDELKADLAQAKAENERLRNV